MEMFNHIPLITILTGNNLSHSSSVGSEIITTKYYFFRSQLLTKTHVLTGENLTKPHFLKELLEKTRVLSINKLTKVNFKKSFQKLGVISFTSLLASCQPSYAIASTNQNLNNHSFNYVEVVAVTGNNQILSKSTSVTTPQRHCGFFAPVIYSASQAIKCNAKMTTAHLRPKSVYDWMTRPNKPMANKSGGSSRPRVNPVALISQFSVTSHNSKLLGVAHHG